MKHLQLPASLADELKQISTTCRSKGWLAHQTAWDAAYHYYFANGGNAWKLSPINLSISSEQYCLYDSRKGGGPIYRLRHSGGHLSCPMCGSLSTSQLDHYLPRTTYPEYSILRANLIPACNHCNSGSKGIKILGVGSERFIQPYFDKWADKALWWVKFQGPYAAVRFHPYARKHPVPKRQEIVRFHLQNVLGSQFYRSMDVQWSTAPRNMAVRLDRRTATIGDFKAQVRVELRSAVVTTGRNSWSAAFYRGLLKNDAAMEFLYHRFQVGA